MMSARTLLTAATSDFGTFGLIFPMPTPFCFSPNVMLLPPLKFPSTTLLIAMKHRSVDPLHGAREDVRAEEGLVGIDADAPDALLLRRVKRAQAAAARNLEDRSGALLDLVQRDLLALRLIREVLRVAVQHLDARVGGLRAGLIARDETIDRRLLLTADRTDHVRARAPLLLEAREVADEVAGLLLVEEQTEEVRRLVRFLGLVDVDDGEVRVREVRRHGVDRGRLGEADADRQVIGLARERREVRDVLLRRLRLVDALLDSQLRCALRSPRYERWLKPRSLSPPMSVTRPILIFLAVLPVVVVLASSSRHRHSRQRQGAR